MSQFDSYNAGKAEIMNRYDRLEQALRLVGADADIERIVQARKTINGDALCIALLGAFSDGKTSVAAGWLGNVTADMKIDADESSDALISYEVPSLAQKVTIIDTPGLFGDKVLESEQRYDDLTRRFISGAHIVLYVVDATNPIKDSHRDPLRWVMRDLGKLESTIFVINKMDQVADLRDSAEFDEQATIKRENIIKKLQRYLELDAPETEAINVVCIAANPAGRGLEFWLGEHELYEHRSRIDSLRHEAGRVLASSSRQALLRKTGASVLHDLISRRLDEVATELQGSDELEAAFGRQIERLRKDVADGERSVIEAAGTLRDELFTAEGKLLVQIRSLTREGVSAFIDAEIGINGDDVGFRLRSRIDRAVQRCSKQSLDILQGVSANVDNTLSSTSAIVDALASSALSVSTKGLGALGKLPPETIKAGIFAARDALGKAVGLAIKFKPWEAAKYAGAISKFAGPVGAGLQVFGDIVSAVRNHSAEKQLAEMKVTLTNLVKLHFQTVYSFLDMHDKVVDSFAPQLAEFRKLLEQQVSQLGEVQQRMAALQAARDALRELQEGASPRNKNVVS
jgi:predicted  nucleic acid-binding Zn-ribbon protein